MEGALVLALLASGTSLVVSLTVAILHHRSAAAIERIKARVELQKTEIQGLVAFLKTANTLIQEFRDKLDIFRRSAPEDTAIILGDLEAVRIKYLDTYKAHVGSLDQDVKDATHGVKNKMLQVVSEMNVALTDGRAIDTEYIMSIRTDLQNVQATLTAMLYERLRRFADV